MQEKCADELYQEWAMLREETGEPTWPELGTFEYSVSKILRPRLNLSQKLYWYCWAQPNDVQGSQPEIGTPYSSDNAGIRIMCPPLLLQMRGANTHSLLPL